MNRSGKIITWQGNIYKNSLIAKLTASVRSTVPNLYMLIHGRLESHISNKHLGLHDCLEGYSCFINIGRVVISEEKV